MAVIWSKMTKNVNNVLQSHELIDVSFKQYKMDILCYYIFEVLSSSPFSVDVDKMRLWL